MDNRFNAAIQLQNNPRHHFVYICGTIQVIQMIQNLPILMSPCSVHHQLHLVIKYASQMLHNAFVWDIFTP